MAHGRTKFVMCIVGWCWIRGGRWWRLLSGLFSLLLLSCFFGGVLWGCSRLAAQRGVWSYHM